MAFNRYTCLRFCVFSWSTPIERIGGSPTMDRRHPPPLDSTRATPRGVVPPSVAPRKLTNDLKSAQQHGLQAHASPRASSEAEPSPTVATPASDNLLLPTPCRSPRAERPSDARIRSVASDKYTAKSTPRKVLRDKYTATPQPHRFPAPRAGRHRDRQGGLRAPARRACVKPDGSPEGACV